MAYPILSKHIIKKLAVPVEPRISVTLCFVLASNRFEMGVIAVLKLVAAATRISSAGECAGMSNIVIANSSSDAIIEARSSDRCIGFHRECLDPIYR